MTISPTGRAAAAPERLGVSSVGADDAPWVDVPGGQRRLVHADPTRGVWALGVRYEPGSGTDRHHHTGEVFGSTMSGRWLYAEHGVECTAGSFVHETAGSTHTLVVPAESSGITELVFVVHGANLILDEHDRVVRINDASTFAARYRELCIAHGKPVPAFLVHGSDAGDTGGVR
jgi:quercetin dioxygenase-like cupin family protein